MSGSKAGVVLRFGRFFFVTRLYLTRKIIVLGLLSNWKIGKLKSWGIILVLSRKGKLKFCNLIERRKKTVSEVEWMLSSQILGHYKEVLKINVNKNVTISLSSPFWTYLGFSMCFYFLCLMWYWLLVSYEEMMLILYTNVIFKLMNTSNVYTGSNSYSESILILVLHKCSDSACVGEG